MITIGVDAHKCSHQALALDETGTMLSHWRGANTIDDWSHLLAWATSLPGPWQWGIEGAWNYGRGLAQCLVARSEIVYEVNPRCDLNPFFGPLNVSDLVAARTSSASGRVFDNSDCYVAVAHYSADATAQ